MVLRTYLILEDNSWCSRQYSRNKKLSFNLYCRHWGKIYMQVNLDSKTRLQTMSSLSRPSAHTFEQSQRRIESLMEKDSYQRFLRSDLYHALITCRPAPFSTTSQSPSSPQPPSPQQQQIPPLPTTSSSSALSPSPVRSPSSSSRPGRLDWCSAHRLHLHICYSWSSLVGAASFHACY